LEQIGSNESNIKLRFEETNKKVLLFHVVLAFDVFEERKNLLTVFWRVDVFHAYVFLRVPKWPLLWLFGAVASVEGTVSLRAPVCLYGFHSAF
jgi:hypothetical protein